MIRGSIASCPLQMIAFISIFIRESVNQQDQRINSQLSFEDDSFYINTYQRISISILIRGSIASCPLQMTAFISILIRVSVNKYSILIRGSIASCPLKMTAFISILIRDSVNQTDQRINSYGFFIIVDRLYQW